MFSCVFRFYGNHENYICVYFEGFQPAVFVSSKDKRGEKSGQRPEDFMDDEVGFV